MSEVSNTPIRPCFEVTVTIAPDADPEWVMRLLRRERKRRQRQLRLRALRALTSIQTLPPGVDEAALIQEMADRS